MKRYLTLLLAVLLVANATACGSGEQNAKETTTAKETVAENTDNTTVEETAETEAKPDLPDITFDGYTFRIMGAADDLSKMHATEMTGEMLNDTIYEANLEVMEKYGIALERIEGGDLGVLKSLIISGQDDVDLAYMHDCNTALMSLDGWFYDINTLPYPPSFRRLQ